VVTPKISKGTTVVAGRVQRRHPWHASYLHHQVAIKKRKLSNTNIKPEDGIEAESQKLKLLEPKM
jgi:hypothetical protein